jgi:murein DD-endopeptidase MepM/ murein hydrolase activator NlpD
MKKNIILLLCAVLCFPLALPYTVFAASKSLTELRQERQRIRNAISGTQNELNSTQNEMRKVQLEILELDETLTITFDDLEKINQSLEETIERLNKTEEELELAREERDTQFEIFRERLRVMHEYGSVSFLEVLLNAASIRDFLARWEFVNSVAKSDQEMVDRMQAAEDRVADKVEELARQRNTVEALQFTYVAKSEELELALAAQQRYFEELSENEERYQALLAQQRETERGIQAEYNKELAAEQAREAERLRNMPMPQGQLQWPVPSSTRITDQYGTRRHPIHRRTEHHSGVDIGARTGSDIVAAEAGIVRTASRQGGYGNTVIIEHSGGMSTLYAHASKILVSVGQRVERGQTIALIGSTGVSTGPHLHFEVRLNGKDVNPKGYLGY